LVERYLPPDQAKARVLRAFVQKALEQEPVFALPYDEAEIDWATGSVKIPRKRERFYPTFRRAEFERYFFEIAAMTSPMTDAEIRGRLLKHIYELRNNNDGWVPTSDIILSPEQVSRRAISNACQQLADAGYIQWHPFNPPIEQLAIGRAKITGTGIDVVTGARVPTIDVRFPNIGVRDTSAAPTLPKEPQRFQERTHFRLAWRTPQVRRCLCLIAAAAALISTNEWRRGACHSRIKPLLAACVCAVGMWATRLRCPSEAAYPQPAGDSAVGSAAPGGGAGG